MTKITPFITDGSIVIMEDYTPITEHEQIPLTAVTDRNGNPGKVDIRGHWGVVSGIDGNAVSVDLSNEKWDIVQNRLKKAQQYEAGFLGQTTLDAQNIISTGITCAHSISHKGLHLRFSANDQGPEEEQGQVIKIGQP